MALRRIGHRPAPFATAARPGGPRLGAHARGPHARDRLQRRPASAVVADQCRAVPLTDSGARCARLQQGSVSFAGYWLSAWHRIYLLTSTRSRLPNFSTPPRSRVSFIKVKLRQKCNVQKLRIAHSAAPQFASLQRFITAACEARTTIKGGRPRNGHHTYDGPRSRTDSRYDYDVRVT